MRLVGLTEKSILKTDPIGRNSEYFPPKKDIGFNPKVIAGKCADHLAALRMLNKKNGNDQEIAQLLSKLQNRFERSLGQELTQLKINERFSFTGEIIAREGKYILVLDEERTDRHTVVNEYDVYKETNKGYVHIANLNLPYQNSKIAIALFKEKYQDENN